MEPVINNADQGTPDASNVDNQPVVDVSQGVPLPVQPSVDNFNAANDTPVGGNEPASTPEGGEPDYKAINERLMQQNARNGKLMNAVGIDPLSDLGEQLEAGIITEEQVKNHIAGRRDQYQSPSMPQQDIPNDPISIAEAEQQAAEKQYNEEAATGGISIETNNRLRQADRAVSNAAINSVRMEVTAERQATQANDNINAIRGITHNNPNYAGMDDNLKSSVDLATISMAGFIADQQARNMGIDPANMSPQQAAYFGQQANDQLGELAQYFMNVGANQVRAGQNPTPNVNGSRNQFVPAPAGNGNMNTPTQPSPYAKGNLDNHRELAAKYAAGGRQL